MSMKFIAFLMYCSFVNAINASSLQSQVIESIEERAVTVKMMQDRLYTIKRREDSIRNLSSHMIFLPEDVDAELQTLHHDKKALIYIIKSMKEER